MSDITYGVVEVNSGVVFAKSIRPCYEIKNKINNAKVGIVDSWDFNLPREILKIITVNLSSNKHTVDQINDLSINGILVNGNLHMSKEEPLDYIYFCDNPAGLFELLKMN